MKKSEVATYYVLADDDGWAVNDPIEGWIMTTLKNHATRFGTAELAIKANKEHYKSTLQTMKVSE